MIIKLRSDSKRITGRASIALIILVLISLLFTGCNKEQVEEVAKESLTEYTNDNAKEAVNMTSGSSLKVGDYILLGNYQVEDEECSPILWMVIDSNSHYLDSVNPAVDHLTLLSAYIIDIRGFDAIEPKNSNDLRSGYGNGRYRTSNIRQWLNSKGSANNWWKAQNLDDGEPGTNDADEPPSDEGFLEFTNIGYDDKDGFLKLFTDDELGAILDTTLVVGKNNATDGGGSETVIDKVFLLSLTEMGLGNRAEVEEGKVFELFESDNSRKAEVSMQCINNTNCLDKSLENKNWCWWLRSPSSGFPASTFMISNIGAALYSTADMCEGPVGVRPALNIRSDLYFSGSGTKDDPYIIVNDAVYSGEVKDSIVKEDSEDEVKIEESDESSKSQKVEITIIEDTELSSGDKLLQSICSNVIDEYPEWMSTSGSIVVWKDSDNSICIRRSPDSPTWALNSPVGKQGDLINVSFVNEDTIGYIITGQDNKGIIGLWQFDLDEYGAKLKYSDYSTIYEMEDSASIRDISFINKNEFLIFYILESKDTLEEAAISYIDTSNNKEEILLKFDVIPIGRENNSCNIQKVSVSPKGTNAYIIYNSIVEKQGVLLIYNLSDRKKIDELILVSSAVWIGDNYILYSSMDEDKGIFIYNVENKSSYEITRIDPCAVDLTFCPKSGGIIAYNINPTSYDATGCVVSCKNWQELSSKTNCVFEAITDEDTVIFSRYVPDNSGKYTEHTVEEGGYWRLDSKWGLHLTYEFSTFNNNPILATVWSRY